MKPKIKFTEEATHLYYSVAIKATFEASFEHQIPNTQYKQNSQYLRETKSSLAGAVNSLIYGEAHEIIHDLKAQLYAYATHELRDRIMPTIEKLEKELVTEHEQI